MLTQWRCVNGQPRSIATSRSTSRRRRWINIQLLGARSLRLREVACGALPGKFGHAVAAASLTGSHRQQRPRGPAPSSHAEETAAATAVGLAVATMGASAAALATGLGVAAGTVSVGGAYVPITVAVSTSLYAAFGATTTTITTATTGAVTTAMPQAAAVIGAASWAGVVAAPVAAAIWSLWSERSKAWPSSRARASSRCSS